MGRKTTAPDESPHAATGSRIEWAVAAVSSVIVAAMIGFLLFEAVTTSHAHPDPVASVEQVTPASDGFRLTFNARNMGQATAASVTFRATLRQDGQVVEQAEVTFDYLPARASQQGAFIFAQNPRLFDVALRAVSYTLP